VKKTAAEIAKIKKRTRQAVDDFLKTNKIAPAGKKGKYPTYDCDKEPLASYLNGKQKPPQEKPRTPEKKQKQQEKPQSSESAKSAESSKSGAAEKFYKPLNALLADKMPEGKKPSAYFYMKALKIAEDNQDAPLLAKLAQLADKEDRDEMHQTQMLKTMQAQEQIHEEKARRMKLENDIVKGKYIELEKAKILFGRVYAVHTAILGPLDLKLADTIDAIPPGEERRGKISALIKSEIYAALGSIQRLLSDFVTGEKQPCKE
jgi:hypothetical protein